jgi:hypothetical protein
MGRKIGWYVSIAVVLVSSALGVWNGLSDWEINRTPLQASVTIGVLAHSLVGFAAAIALIRKAPAARWLTLLWTVLVAYVSSTASIAYAGDDATVGGAIAGGLGSALIGLAIHWCARVVTREPNAAVAQHAQAAR